jgi:hypothetical protein
MFVKQFCRCQIISIDKNRHVYSRNETSSYINGQTTATNYDTGRQVPLLAYMEGLRLVFLL